MRIEIAERRRQQGTEGHEIVLGDHVWMWPPDLSPNMIGALRKFATGKMDEVDEGYRLLYGEHADAAMLLIGVKETIALVEDLYGLTPGESPASTGSSRNGGTPSRRTSSASTPRTSPKRSSARSRGRPGG